ncbi:hybrid sensor histidine kinase/response regulator [Pedobacter chinensis]|uniref:histidine kinase n=1 Tax=Pedobacter chinensis TaxID=2282421 RepID=A0A369PPL5_9SPHI|nr:hybrid sensor histidine kinase/response regulator transcription factor [Pedobacter chinensis]RDC54533.1 hybrid sensor histidine kinase/response regulator [Pedobacter chinensis]
MLLNSLKYLLSAILFLGFIFSAKSQQPVLFDHLGIEKGLSQTSVLSITQDGNGFMWFGTRYGLNRYDGYNIKVYQYSETDSTSISNNYITCLFSDSRKNLWIGTSVGLNLYNEKGDAFERVITQTKNPKGISSHVINCFTEDKKGNIWIGTLNGLNLLKDGNLSDIKKFFNTKTGNGPYHNVRSVMEDHEGNIWVGTSNGLLKMTAENGKYKTTVFQNHGNAADISENYITNIIEDRNHQIWISTQSKGLNLFIPATQNFKHFKHTALDQNSIISNTLRNMVVDDAGKLWVGTLDGISIMDTQNFSCKNLQFDPDNKRSLNQNSVHRLYKDQNGSIWVGTYFGGININYPYTTAFTIYNRSRSRSSINNNVISGFAEDENKNLWIGTEGGGVNYFDRANQRFTAFQNTGNSNTLRSNLVKKVYLAHDGKLWIGTHSGGLNVYDVKTKTFKSFNFSSQNEDVPDEITAIVEDKTHHLIVATQRNGIKISNPEKTTFYKFNLPPSFSASAKVKALMVSGYRTYFGTTNGFFIYDEARRQFYSILDPQSMQPISYYINCITETKNKEIYIGTYNNGLVLYDQKKNNTIVYTVKNGLPNNNILGILEDEKDNLWISTANGLSMFDRKNKTFKNYTVADGLPGNEFNANAFFKSSTGEMFFGGYNGFISFFPDHIQSNNKASKLVITELKLHNKPVKINGEDGLLDQNVSLKDKLIFASDQNTFSLSFALLNFIKPEKNRYAYKLDGFEKNWNYVNTSTASYTNLPSGSYTFLVKGINNDGIYSANVRQITIVVNPPFYRTWWAYLFYFCVLSAILFIVVRYLLIRAVLTKEKEINEHKLEFFTNISHEIRTPLTLIVGPLEKLMENAKDNPSLNRDLQPIKNNADRLMNLVTELLDFRKAESGKMKLNVSPGNLVKFCKEIFIAFQNMALSKEIDYIFKSEKEEIELYFDKVQMEKVLFNLLSNAFKFTPNGGKISLEITLTEQLAILQICDNGNGIPLENQSNLFNNFYQANANTTIGTGLGLSFSKSIVELHHGKITFKSTPVSQNQNGSTCFMVSLKTGKAHFNPSDFITDYVYYDDAINYNLPEASKNQLTGVNEQPDQKKRKYNILLVEDNNDVRAFIKDSIKETYNIYESENGLKGLESATELIPDLIISDVMMPVMDGLELCRKLKTDERTSHIPVILLTARSAYVHQINGFENGADAYIMKPFNLKILELNIHNLLNARETIKRKFAQVITLEPKNMVINSTEQNFLNKIIQIIEDHMADPEFDVPTLSSAIGMSQPVLYKKIRALTDLSVNDFIKSLRIKRAAQLLKQNAGNIAEVAYAVGFNDRKYFSLEFKKHFGKNPSEFMQGTNV